MSEAFVYMWYIASTGMYYIGYSGKDSDEYTHSSKDEEFCKLVPNSYSSIVERRDFLKKIPKGIRRRVLARGTREEMIELEHELLENRKAKCWDRYYNIITFFPPPPMSGEDHYNFGKTGEKNPLFGKKRSEETKRKISEAKKGIPLPPRTEEHCRKISEVRGKACVSPEGVVYASLKEAARQSPHPYNTLRDWCHANKNGWYWFA